MRLEKRREISLLLLRLSAAVFGLVTLLESGAAFYLSEAQHRLEEGAGAAGVIGGADGPTAISVTIAGNPPFLVPVLFALAPVCTAVTLFLLHRRKKQRKNAEGKTV